MQTEAVFFLVAGLACVGIFGAIAGAPGSPAVAGGTYEVTVPTDDLFAHPTPNDDAASASVIEVLGLERGASGPPAWLGPAGIVLVLGAWLLVAFRLMGPPGVTFLLLATAALLGAGYFLGLGGTQAATPAASRPVGSLAQLVLLLVALVTVASGVALFLPDDADVYSADIGILQPLLSVLSDLLDGLPRRASASRVSPPDDEVHRLWWQLARRYGDDRHDWTSLTPGEVARAAHRDTVPDEAVDDLREVFERVRYGDVRATDERVERARAAWERIETSAGLGGGTVAGGGSRTAEERGASDE